MNSGSSRVDSAIATAAVLNPIWWPTSLYEWLQVVLALAGIIYLLSKNWLLWRSKRAPGDADD